MKNKFAIWIIIVGILLVIIIGLVASLASIYFAKGKIGHQNEIINNRKFTQTSQAYEAPSGDWTLRYPSDWLVSSDAKGDNLTIKKEPIDNQTADLSTIRISRGENKISDLLKELDQVCDYTKEEVKIDGIGGIKIDGTVKESAASMMSPGTKVIEYFFELGDNDVLIIQTNDKSYAKAIEEIVDSMKFNLQGESKPMNNNQSTTAVSDSGNIKVYTPVKGEKISSPYILTGEAIAFEGTVNYSLVDSNDNELSEGFMQTMAPDMGEFGDFTQPITFSTTDSTGTMEVYTFSAKDGSKQDLVKIDVKF